jgi:Tol biopolymer transport system component
VFTSVVGGNTQLFVRDTASSALVALTGTEGGVWPFWSPDGQSVAFFHTDGHLKQVVLPGGEVRVLAEARLNPFTIPGTWRGDLILFAGDDGRLYRVAASGGTPRPVELLPNAQQRRFASPRFLPDGRHFLLSVENDPSVYVASLDAPGITKVLEQGALPMYAAGHLFYARGTALFARPFNAERLEFSAAEMQLTDRGAGLSVSDDGTIVFTSPNLAGATLTWLDRSGRRTGTLGEPGPYQQVVLSPSGRHATVVRTDAVEQDGDLWDLDLATGVFSRLTTAIGLDTDPSWSPDERALAFSSRRGGSFTPFVKDLVSGKEEPLGTFDEPVVVDQWTPDGRFVMVRTLGRRVYAVPIGGNDRTPRLLLETPHIKDEVSVSPDGRWVAFETNESERWEVYVAAFPTFTSKRQVSAAGGVEPHWRADGRELFYLALEGSMMSVRVDTRMGLVVSPPSRLFPTRLAPNPFVPQYAVTADGQRFLGLERATAADSFTFLINWLNATSSNTGRSVQ